MDKNRNKKETVPPVWLADIYELRHIISQIDSNIGQDVKNHMQMDKHQSLIKKATTICDKWIAVYPPMQSPA